jgi:hypothetical protein
MLPALSIGGISATITRLCGANTESRSSSSDPSCCFHCATGVMQRVSTMPAITITTSTPAKLLASAVSAPAERIRASGNPSADHDTPRWVMRASLRAV